MTTPTPCLGFNQTVCTIRATCSHYHDYRQKLETKDNTRTDWITMPLAAHEQCQHYSETPTQCTFTKRNKIY